MALINNILPSPSIINAKLGGGQLALPDANGIQAARDNAQNPTTRDASDDFWVYDAIDPFRWNQYFPYQLIVVQTTQNGYAPAPDFKSFTLPIPPQELSVSMPVAITTSATLGGIVEEHGGAPFRMISFQGTTGIMPIRPNGATATSIIGRSILGGTLNNTIQGFDQFTAAAKGIGTASGSSRAYGGAVMSTNELAPPLSVGTPAPITGTGYYQFRLLERWLETYITLKKKAANRDLRLALAMWKDQSVYLVTPQEFTTRKSASSPNERMYSLQFKAYSRITLQPTYDEVKFTPDIRSPAALQQILNRMQAARQAVAGLKRLAEGVMADARNVIEIMRECTFFTKDLAGAILTMTDIPDSIVADAKSAYVEFMTAGTTPAWIEVQRRLGSAPPSSQNALTATTAAGTRGGAAERGATDTTVSGADPINKIVQNPTDYYDLFAQVKVGSLHLLPDTVKKIADERTRVRKFTRLDFETRRDYIQKVAADFADAVGAGDPTYNTVYNRTNAIAAKAPTDDHFEILFALNNFAMELNRLAVSGEVQRKLSAMDYIAGLARQSGIAFTQPTSKFAIPFPYGSTLEQLSLAYLGTPDRWHEIAALNGLRAPYIDEVGFDLPLLVDGRGAQVVISDATSLFVGQSVWLSSSTTSRTQRHIRNIERVGTAYYLLTLDGDADLDRFTTGGSSVLHAFLPDTVNSMMMLYVPSAGSPQDSDWNGKSIPGINIFDNLIQVGGVDLLMTPQGDLAITPDGDCRLAIGLANLVQRVKVALATPRGSLLHHPDFGLAIKKGQSIADVSAKQLLDAASNLFTGDPAFTGVYAANIVVQGPVASISLAVGVAGASQLLPVTVQIKQ